MFLSSNHQCSQKLLLNTTSRTFSSIGFGSCNLREFPNFSRNQSLFWELDLSSNNIAGEIPGLLLNVGIYTLRSLNLSHNLLTGFHQQPVVLPWTSLMITLGFRYNNLQGSLPVPVGQIWLHQSSCHLC